MKDFIKVDETWIRASAITRVSNSNGISNCHIWTVDGEVFVTELSVEQVMSLILEAESKSKNFRHSTLRHDPPSWSQR